MFKKLGYPGKQGWYIEFFERVVIQEVLEKNNLIPMKK
jgi:hypothetical protein